MFAVERRSNSSPTGKMDNSADDVGYECTYRYNTHILGFVAVRFDDDPTAISHCVLSRVIIE